MCRSLIQDQNMNWKGNPCILIQRPDQTVLKKCQITTCVVPGELEYGGLSSPASKSNAGNHVASVLHNEPKQDIADDESQPESLQHQSDPSTSSVTWDEKTEIVKPTGISSYEAEVVDRVQDLDSLHKYLKQQI